MDKTGLLILMAVFIVPWLAVLVFILTKKHRSKKYFRRLEEKYELKLVSEGKNTLAYSGYYRGKPIRIDCGTNGKGGKQATTLSVECQNPLNLEILVVKKGRNNSAGAMQTDDEEFDKMFIVHTNDPERVKRLFDFNTRFKLQQVSDLGFKGEIKLAGSSFIYTEPGMLNNDTSVMRLELVLHELCDLADVMKYN